jgi:hypothetical protein
VKQLVAFPAFVTAGLFGNAMFAALSTVSLPLLLDSQGQGKRVIAAFFVCSALGGATLNLTLGRWLVGRGSPRPAVAFGALAAALGMVIIALPHPLWAIFPAGILVMANSLNYPLLIAASGGRGAADLAPLRTLFVVGYLAGLGLFALLELHAATAEARLPSAGATLLALVNACLARLPARAPVPADTTGAAEDDDATFATGGGTPGKSPAAAAGPRLGLVVVVASCLAIILLRGADSLRQVYLPLYTAESGFTGAEIAGLFAVTALFEIIVLVPLGRLSDRWGSRITLVAVAAVGAVSFMLATLAAGYGPLLFSQILYAAFTAGFQSISMVLVAEVFFGGLGRGAASYMALAQVGSTVGVLAPLAIPGYTPAIFAVAAAFCAAGALFLLPGMRSGRPRHGAARGTLPAGLPA